MRRFCFAALTLSLLAITPAIGCSCGPARPASQYIKENSIAFLGRVVFTNDEGSHSFEQKTLVRFRVEEAFKGLTDTEKDVWVDPGSFTSCYAEYAVGERYLVFGDAGERLLKDSSKPLAPGIDPEHPPTIYLAWECSGTRLIPDGPNRSISRDVEYLRKYRKRQHKSLTAEVIHPKFGDSFRLTQTSLEEMLRREVKVDDERGGSCALGWAVQLTSKGDVVTHGDTNFDFQCDSIASIVRKSDFVIMPTARPARNSSTPSHWATS